MDAILPEGLAGEIEVARRNRVRRSSRFTVVAGERTHRVLEFGGQGFVIEADGRPPLRGYVEILDGEDVAARLLVICSWAEDGLVGYECKRDTAGGSVAPDHVPSGLAGLLAAPDRPARRR